MPWPLRLGSFCPFGSALPTSLRVGHYAVDVNGDHTIEKGVDETACPVLHRCSSGDKHECEPNTIPNAESSVCIPCTAGQHRDKNKSVCAKCPIGHYCSNGEKHACNIGTYCPEGSTFAAACLPGSQCELTSSQTKCSAATYQDKEGQIECKMCPAGHACPTEGLVSPVPCAKGSHQGQTAKTTCVPCNSGQYQDVEGATGCKSCRAGFFCTEGAPLETPCPKGTFCPAGSALPTSLSAGHYAIGGTEVNLGGTREVTCEEGHYCSNGDRIACQPGQFCPPGSLSASSCSKGSWCPNGAEQVPCEPGVYCPSGTALPLDCPTGATCTIPASPELIVEYDAALERRESEVTVVVDSFLVGTISYNLSLSVYPLSVVEVTVTKEVEAGADCVEYNDGLSIKRNASFFFDAINWNISQTVHIDIRRDAGVFQGSSTMLFSHSVRSNDPVWKSPFLRPMRLSIIDDDDCVKGAQKFDEIIGGCRIRKCGCAEDFFIEETDSFYCNSVTKCEPCPEGMKCTFQQKLEQAQISNGWYRPNNVSLSVVECPLPHVCVGENTSGDDLCREGHKGPLCLVCRQAHVWTSSEECVLCDSELKISLYLGLGASLLVLAAISANILRRKQIAGRAGRFSTWESFVDKATTKYKIIINFFQILSKMAELHPFRLPTSFLSFFSVFNVFSLDLQLLPFNCLFESDFHSILLATTLLPLVFVLFVYALFILQRLRIQRLSGDVDASRVRHEIDNVQSKCEFTVTLVLISACPIITTTIFQTFV